jgi:hypothetical protein
MREQDARKTGHADTIICCHLIIVQIVVEGGTVNFGMLCGGVSNACGGESLGLQLQHLSVWMV